MFDKMTPNQRLMVALLLSFIFFIGYTTIFPPKVDETLAKEQHKSELVKAADSEVKSGAAIVKEQESVGHEVRSDEKISSKGSNTLVKIESEKFTIEIDSLGRISSKIMKDEKYQNVADGKIAQMIPSSGAKPLQIRFADENVNSGATKVPYTASITAATVTDTAPAEIVLTQKLPEVTVEKRVTFFADGHYNVKISLSNDKRYFIYLGKRPDVSQTMMTIRGNMIYAGDNLTTIFEDGDVEGRSSFTNVHLLSSFDQYFANIFYKVSPDINVMVERDMNSDPVTYIDGLQTITFSGYSGPKDHKILKSIDPILVNSIEYGWFTFAAKPIFLLLSWLHSLFGNWGWAIVAMTLMVRLVLYPLTFKGMMSMAKLKELAPKIKEVQAKYKGDPQRMNVAVMDMYKKHGANPLGGCLPLLLQIPVFFAIYRVLLNAVELQGAPWILWINDLARMDPTYIMPILMGATMYYQQKITPSNFTDPMQEKIFKFLPVIFTFFFITFPAGLVLYWAVNNILSIAQQFMVNRKFEDDKAKRHAEHLAEKHHDKN
jgi:YidC/Oxa1 family membrane protein insertase